MWKSDNRESLSGDKPSLSVDSLECNEDAFTLNTTGVGSGGSGRGGN
jgi:hypothetical protein